MKRLRLVLIVAINFFPFWLGAKQVSPETAKQVAVTQVNSHSQLRSAQNLNLVFTKTTAATDSKTGSVMKSSAATDVLYYVFNTGNGFVIVSGDDVAKPVLGYSGAGAFDPNNLPPNLVYYLDDCLAKEIEQAIAQGVTQSEETKEQWDAYLSGNVATLRAATADSGTPLLDEEGIKWNQFLPYNYQCPVYGGTQTVTGCVATAMAQIMRFHKYPLNGNGTVGGYSTTSLGINVPATNISTRQYIWSNMSPQYTDGVYSGSPQDIAVATLMYDCGRSVNMDYNTAAAGGSAAYISDVGKALLNNFWYSPSIAYKQRAYYSSDEWETILKAQIDSRQPILYGGQDSNGAGHAFVCDGYQDGGYFHFNWGWGGMYQDNTYFLTTVLNPGTGGAGSGSGVYNLGQEIVINIIPDSNAGTPSYEMVLADGVSEGITYPVIFSSTATQIDKNVSFNVTARYYFNIGYFTLSGNPGVALYDKTNQLLQVLSLSTNYDFINGSGWGFTFPCSVTQQTITPGDYFIKPIVIATSGDTIPVRTTVQLPITVKGVTLNNITLNLAVGDNAQLTPNYFAVSSTGVTWTSSASTIATVDGNGLVTGVSTGVATITIKTTDNHTATCNVIVRNPATVTLNPESGSVSGGNLILNETSTGSGVNLPEAIPCNSNWAFAGWSKTLINTPTDPMDASTVSAGLIPAGLYVPSEETLSLYGVYKKYDNQGVKETQAMFADFNNGMPAGWTAPTSYYASSGIGGSPCRTFGVGDVIVTPLITNPSRITFFASRINGYNGSIVFSVEISKNDNNNIWNTVCTYSSVASSWQTAPNECDFSSLEGEYKIRFILNSADANYNYNLILDNVTIYANSVDEGNSFSSIISDCTPATIAWQGGSDTNWSNSQNWQNGRIPTAIDTVVISGTAPNFPELQSGDNASAAEIHFEPGAQIGHQSLLNYGKAFVQYDFSNQVSQRNRWLMLSIPLCQVYPGDFSFGGYPATYMKSFSSSTNGTATSGSWATVTHTGDEAYSFGDAFVFWLNDDNKDGYPKNPDKGLKLLNGIREFPFYQHHAENVSASEREFYENVDQSHTYSNITKESTFYGFVLSGSDYIRDDSKSTAVSRDDSKAYQLAKTGTNFTSIQADFTGGVFALIGNPYMATLDFGAFQQENTGIKKNYYIWTGTGYTIFTPDGNVGPTSATVITSTEQFIPPLQGFIVEKQETEGDNIPLSFNEDMTTVAQKVALRYSANVENKLNIIASTPVAGFNAFIAKRDGGQDEYGDLDARNIINSITDVPDIYTLKPYKDGLIAVGANFINSDDLLIPVGLATSYAGNITLSFSGMNNYDANLSFIDTEANKEIDLTGLTSYDYAVNNYTPKQVNGAAVPCEDRFFIRISKTITGLNGTEVEKANVFEENGHIQVVSGASNLIKEVEVYNQQGALIYKNSSINAISYSVTRNLPVGAYIVKVISEKNTDNVKVIIK